MNLVGNRDRWRRDPVAFIQEVLVNPDDNPTTGARGGTERYKLFPEQAEFIRRAFTLRPQEDIYAQPRRGVGPRASRFRPLAQELIDSLPAGRKLFHFLLRKESQ